MCAIHYFCSLQIVTETIILCKTSWIMSINICLDLGVKCISVFL